jgi:hypothetical protein
MAMGLLHKIRLLILAPGRGAEQMTITKVLVA